MILTFLKRKLIHMNKKITNITKDNISLFVKIKDVEQKVEILAREELIVDDYETKTIIIFKKRGFITMEPFSIAQMMESEASHLLNEVAIESKTIDETVDSNNDEVMDHFHTTETQEVVTEEIKDIEHFQENLFKNLQVPTKLEIVEEEVEQYVEDGYIKGSWSDEDTEFLKKNYPTKGRTFCSVHLNRNESSVQKKINSMGLKKRKKRKR